MRKEAGDIDMPEVFKGETELKPICQKLALGGMVGGVRGGKGLKP